jgi:pyridoxamine 5'-phosphate oxidase
VTTRPNRDLAALRREYGSSGLHRDDVGDDPITTLLQWLAAVEDAGLHEPNAMVLTTLAAQGPSSRMVLLKGLDERGLVFYTNYRSRKASELDANPACAVLFPWHPLQRQVHLVGVASRVSPEESDAYFASRPRSAQVGAWASAQSQVVPSREFLEARYAEEEQRFAGLELVPRPQHWGGYLVAPHRIEFWQGRASRMHDRFVFERTGGSSWRVDRLAP